MLTPFVYWVVRGTGLMIVQLGGGFGHYESPGLLFVYAAMRAVVGITGVVI